MSKAGFFKNSPMMQDVLMVVNTPEKEPLLKVTATFHTEKEDFKPVAILLIENNRDYYKDTGESFALTFQIGLGDYIYRLLPFVENLEVSIKEEYQSSDGVRSKVKKPRSTRFKVLLDLQKNPNPQGEMLANRSIEDLNFTDPIQVNVELVDRREEVFRVLPVDGIFPSATVDSLINGLTMDICKGYKVDGKPIIDVIQADPSDNKTPYKNLFITPRIHLRDLPGWLQENAKGVYSAGIGSFFQSFDNKATWFTYPLFRPERFDSDCKRLVVMAVPENEFPGIENTYRTEGKLTYVISTGVKKVISSGRNSELNRGTGYRMADAEAFMNKPVQITENGIKAKRNSLNFEVADRSRRDGIALAPSVGVGSTPFIQISRILSNRFSAITISWENSDPNLLYPGMPVKYCYMEKGKYMEVKGTLARVFSGIVIQGNPMVNAYHRRSSQLVIMAELPNNFPTNEGFSLSGLED